MKTSWARMMMAAAMAAAMAFVWPAGADPRVWDGTSGYWTNATKWGGTVPQPGDAVTLPAGSYTVTLDRATSDLASFTQNGGILFFTNWTAFLRATEVQVNTGTVTHAVCATNAAPDITNRVYIIATNVTIASNGQINVNSRGYPGALTAPYLGFGPGGGRNDNDSGGGGGYGGYGGWSLAPYGAPYGLEKEPADPGSSGATRTRGGTSGGSGGGVVRIEAAGRVTVNGLITACGGDNVGYAGGGSGGAIWISCDTFAGADTGRIIADGGQGNNYASCGGGGGGRVAIRYDAAHQQSAGLTVGVRFSVSGGEKTSALKGTSGTLYLTDAQCLPYDWLGGGVLYFGAGVTAAIKTYPNLIFRGGTLDYQNLEVDFTVTGNLTAVGASDFFSQGRFGTNTSLKVTGDVAITNGTLTVGTNLAVTGKIQLASGSSLTVYSSSNRPGMVTCGGDFTMITNSKLYVYAADTNASFPEYGARVDIGGDMKVISNSWVYPGVWNSVNTNKTLGAVKFQMKNLIVSSNSGFNAVGAGYAGGKTNYFWYGFGPGGGYYGGINSLSGGGGYGGYGARSNVAGAFGCPYGSATNANRHGSGGSIAGYNGESRGSTVPAGAGGGVIWIQAAGDVTMDGTLIADGGTIPNYNGGGSGGGILVQAVGNFSGAPGSLLSSRGGNTGTYNGGSGGGGRVAVWRRVPAALRDSLSRGEEPGKRIETSLACPEFAGNIYVNGGTGSVVGTQGTALFLTGIPPPGTLIMVW